MADIFGTSQLASQLDECKNSATYVTRPTPGRINRNSTLYSTCHSRVVCIYVSIYGLQLHLYVLRTKTMTGEVDCTFISTVQMTLQIVNMGFVHQPLGGLTTIGTPTPLFLSSNMSLELGSDACISNAERSNIHNVDRTAITEPGSELIPIEGINRVRSF